nr:hypothetical protein [Tanacetum cinerariifolium]
TRVYFVKGLGHNLFSVGQFCDADLEVTFRRNTCFIRDLDGVDFLKGIRSTNLYTINLYDMASTSPTCLMARATPTKSWLWHQRLSHLSFDTINDLAKNDIVYDLPKFKYAKEQLCPSYEMIMKISVNLVQKDRQIENVRENDGNQFGQYAGQVAQNQQGFNAWQNGRIQGAQNAGVQSGRNQNGLVVIIGIAKQSGTGNVVAARDEGIQLQAKEFDFMAAAGDLDEIEEVNANCNLMVNLQQASTSSTQHDRAPFYDTDGSAENDNHVTSVTPSMVHSGGTIETSSAPNEEIRAHQETVYRNLVDQVAQDKAYNDMQQKVKRLQAHLRDLKGTSVTPYVDKPKLSAVTPRSKKLHASTQSHSVPQPSEFNVVRHRSVIAPGMFKINPSQTPRENVSSNMATVSFTGLAHTARTRRPQPKRNTRNAKVLSASKSSEVKKIITVEDHRRTLLLSKNRKTMSSECNNIKLAIQNDKSKIVCDTCKQCLVTANHDACLNPFMNVLHLRANKLCANVPLSANQKRHRTQVWKPKQVGSKERLASKPRLPRLSLKRSPSGCSFDQKGKLVASKGTSCPNDDKDCTSNPQEPMRKWFPNSSVFLGRLSKFICGFGACTLWERPHCCFLGYGDLKWGDITVIGVYFVEGLDHNLFSVGQFCDADLEVAFRRNTCFIRDLDGVDLLKGNRSTNLYTINLYDMASASLICLMARATPIKSWLWHQRLSHLNFHTINDLDKNDLVSSLLKFKYAKEHLCSSCEQGKSKRASHPPKPVTNSKQQLHLLHMDLYGPMRVASINGKRYVLVIVDDYSRYTWVHFLRTKDETPEVIKNFLKKISGCLHAPVIIVHTDNGTEFKNHVLKEYFDSVGIKHETSAAKTPQQNGVVEHKNRTLVEAVRTMMIFSHALLFLWAEAIATAVYNPRIRKIMETMNVTFDELSAMAFEQNSSRPGLQSMTSGQPFHNEYLGGRPAVAPRAIHAAPVQQRNLTPSPTASAANNVLNAGFEGELFVNPFGTPSTESIVSSTQYRTLSTGSDKKSIEDGDMCIYALTVNILEPKTVKEALTYPAWIESMQEELHQFIRLDVWELVS